MRWQQIFPPWERDIPKLGTWHSHTGNKVFPRWEQMPRLGSVNKQHLSDNKERLLQNNAPLLQNKEPLLQHKAVIRHRVLVEDW